MHGNQKAKEKYSVFTLPSPVAFASSLRTRVPTSCPLWREQRRQRRQGRFAHRGGVGPEALEARHGKRQGGQHAGRREALEATGEAAAAVEVGGAAKAVGGCAGPRGVGGEKPGLQGEAHAAADTIRGREDAWRGTRWQSPRHGFCLFGRLGGDMYMALASHGHAN